MLNFHSVLSPKLFNSKVNIKTLDTSTLGWIRPDGVINFQNPGAAYSYAKNRVLQALNSDLPFEKGIIIKKNRVLAEINGDFNKIDTSNFADKHFEAANFIHGHPDLYDGGTLPLSLADFLTQVGHRFKRMIAFNKDGEYSMLEEKQDKKFYNFLPVKMREFLELASRVGTSATALEKFTKMWAKFFPSPLRDSVRKMMHAAINNELLSGQKTIDAGRKLLNNQKLVQRIGVLENEIIKNGTAAKSINDFWKANADKFGYKYSTNFSNLKQAPGPL